MAWVLEQEADFDDSTAVDTQAKSRSLPPHWRTVIQKGLKMRNPLLVGQIAPQSVIMNFRKMQLSVLKQICKIKTGFLSEHC